MKKVLSILALVAITTSMNAQWGSKKIKGDGNVTTVSRDLKNYDKVNVAGSFDVFLVAGTEGTITIEAEKNLLDYIETENEGSALKIKVKKGYDLQPSRNRNIVIIVPFKDLEEVTLAGSGDVMNKDMIKAKDFTCAVAGSGDLVLEVEADSVEGKVAGSGDLTLKGKAGSAKYAVAGSGDIHARDMKAKDAEASIAGSGDIVLNCDGGMLKARVAGSGDIEYSGTPAKMDTKVSGSGSVSN